MAKATVKGKKKIKRKPAKGKKTKRGARPAKPIDFSKPLKNKFHEAFCREYHKSSNATDSYLKAYTKSTAKSANAAAPRMLVNVSIGARLAYLRSQLSVKCDINAEMIMAEFAKIGFANIKNCVKTDNMIDDISKLPDEVTAAISSISTRKNPKGGKEVRLVFHDKGDALENMCKMIGGYGKNQAPLADVLATLMQEIGSNGSGLPIKT